MESSSIATEDLPRQGKKSASRGYDFDESDITTAPMQKKMKEEVDSESYIGNYF